MLGFLERFVNRLEVDLKNRRKNEQFYSSSSELVRILFAVVFGVGLAELGRASGLYDWSVLFLAYTAIVLSWWGYHYATVAGPSETNVLNYFIDYVLLGVYWFLMNSRTSLFWVLALYLIMFVLYSLWELVRNVGTEDQRIKNAIKVNSVFSLIILCLWVLHFSKWMTLQDWVYVPILYALIVGYRVWIRYVYRPEDHIRLYQGRIEDTDKKLVERAKSVAANARIHLSGFAVGAAVLADTDRIYVGCNIEFDNYSNTIHAEEAAISAAMAAGEKCIASIAIFTFSDRVYFPCGMCRQSLFELGGKDLRVIACSENSCEITTIGELLPSGFHL